MKTKILYLLSFAAALTLTGCPDPCIDELPIYNFQITASFTPESDSIKAGDTLFLVSEFSKRLVPSGSMENVDYSNANIRSNLSVTKLTQGTRFGTDAVFDFDYISEVGRIYNVRDIPSPDGFQQLDFQEFEDKYKLKVGFIPKERGVYSLGIVSTASRGRNGEKGCDQATFNTMVTNSDIHYYYLEEFSPTSVSSPPPTNAYYFKVY